MNERKKIDLKNKIKTTPKKKWIIIGGFVLVFIVIIACLLVAMYMSGYTLASWMAQFYPWVIMTVAVLFVIIFTILFFKSRKSR